VAGTPTEIKSKARAYANVAIQSLGTIARRGKSEASRIAAATALLDRGYGKAAQTHEHSGKDGGPITVRVVYGEEDD